MKEVLESTRKFCILVVEDNPADVALIREGFRNCNIPHVLVVVKNGVEATNLLRQQGEYNDSARPDLILLDLSLPLKSGHEVLDDIKTDRALRSIPVIVLSASGAKVDVDRAYTHQANSYVEKPKTLTDTAQCFAASRSFGFTFPNYLPQAPIVEGRSVPGTGIAGSSGRREPRAWFINYDRALVRLVIRSMEDHAAASPTAHTHRK